MHTQLPRKTRSNQLSSTSPAAAPQPRPHAASRHLSRSSDARASCCGGHASHGVGVSCRSAWAAARAGGRSTAGSRSEWGTAAGTRSTSRYPYRARRRHACFFFSAGTAGWAFSARWLGQDASPVKSCLRSFYKRAAWQAANLASGHGLLQEDNFASSLLTSAE